MPRGRFAARRRRAGSHIDSYNPLSVGAGLPAIGLHGSPHRPHDHKNNLRT